MEQESDDSDDVPLSKRNDLTQQSPDKAMNGKRKRNAAYVDQDSSSEEDVPLAKQRSNGVKVSKVKDESESEEGYAESSPPKAKKNGRSKKVIASDSDSDAPIAKSSAIKAKKAKKAAPPESDSDEVPLVTKVKKGKLNGKASISKKPKAAPKEESDVDLPVTPKKARKRKVSEVDTKSPSTPKSKKSKAEDEDDEEENFKWWENDQLGDGTSKWTTLEHNGVLFAPPYEPLPKNVKMKYDGMPVTLDDDAEEVAGFFAALLETDHAKNTTFVKNFFDDFKAVLKRNPKNPKIASFDKCDFKPMFEYFEQQKAIKKAMTKEEKKAIKDAKDALEEPMKFCLLDGRKEKVGNFRIEPPGLFRGRGQHPKTGKLKTRIQPEQITINIGKGAKVPAPPKGHKWAKVIHDDTVTWLATWTENINSNIKYVFLAAGSSLKGQSDMKKFEKARELKKHVSRIRSDYQRDLRDKVMSVRQRATAMYLIDIFALRAGNEKGDDEADTVGCCSLRYEHVMLTPPRTVVFDFLGKDSIRYYNEVEVEEQVFKNLKIFKKEPKTDGDMLFDRLTTAVLNKHLGSYMTGLSAKVFRTYNASHTFEEQLKNTPKNGSVADKLLAYNRANREVAILCNHQRSVAKNHDTMIGKIEDKINALKYQRWKLRRTILTMEPGLAKKRKDLTKKDPELTDEWMIEHEATLLEKEREKIRKKFEKENEKLEADGERPMKESELDERLKEVSELKKLWVKERKSGNVEPKRAVSVEKLDENIAKIEERIKATEIQRTDRDENKTTALGTSKLNYLDPRLTAAWCKKFDVPIEKIFSKTLREKFPWALDVDADWKF